MTKTELEIDIRPESDIYETYRRLSYHPWYAIAEFVDNSTGNYELHRRALQKAAVTTPYLTVDIFYDRSLGTLTVIDNAHGMEVDEFKRALQLAKPPPEIGRSEFGMGLKTAACWLGPKWRVSSKQLKSDREFYAEVDVGRLKHDKPRSLLVDVTDGLDRSTHYTRVDIEGLDQYERVFVGRTVGKIKEELASIYRRDIANGEIAITFNGEVLSSSQPALLEEDGTLWRKDLNFVINKKHVTGWIGVLDSGKAADAGFHIFRRGRLISGGTRQGWKPYDIFKSPNSFMSQRLIGELDFDEWRISHTKDRIQMSGADEDKLLKKLVDLSSDYVQKARESRSEQGITLTKEAARHVIETTQEELKDNDALGAAITIVEEGILPDLDPAEAEEIAALIEQLGEPIQIVFGGTKFPTLNLALSDDAHESEPLVRVGFPDEDTLNMVLNLNHPFVRNFVGDNYEIMRVLAHWLYVDALVERIQRRNPGLDPGTARLLKDSFLRTLEPVEGFAD